MINISFFKTIFNTNYIAKIKHGTANKIIFIYIFTSSSHTEYVKRESIVIAWVKNAMFCMSWNTKQEKNSVCLSVWPSARPPVRPSVCLSVCRSVCLSVCLAVRTYVRTWILAVDTIIFEGVCGSKQNLVGVFYVWNVGLVFFIQTHVT